MSLVFSSHCLLQIKRRKIKKVLVRETAYHYDEIESSFRKSKLRRKMIDDRILEIVTITEGSRITVITGYYLN